MMNSNENSFGFAAGEEGEVGTLTELSKVPFETPYEEDGQFLLRELTLDQTEFKASPYVLPDLLPFQAQQDFLQEKRKGEDETIKLPGIETLQRKSWRGYQVESPETSDATSSFVTPAAFATTPVPAPFLSQPILPTSINYQPLLENLRPIKRTEEIVRFQNDGGKIAIIETTDDPGKVSFRTQIGAILHHARLFCILETKNVKCTHVVCI